MLRIFRKKRPLSFPPFSTQPSSSQHHRAADCCPAGGNDVFTVPQVLKDRVDGELGPQTHETYPPACLLMPTAAACCETNTCCVMCGKTGSGGTFGAESDPEQGSRRGALCLNLLLVLASLGLFFPVFLSLLFDQDFVDDFYWAENLCWVYKMCPSQEDLMNWRGWEGI